MEDQSKRTEGGGQQTKARDKRTNWEKMGRDWKKIETGARERGRENNWKKSMKKYCLKKEMEKGAEHSGPVKKTIFSEQQMFP